MLSSETLGDALALGLKYMSFLVEGMTFDFSQDGSSGCIHPRFHASPQIFSLHRFFTETLMAGMARSAAWLMGDERIGEGELWFDYPQPPYFVQYAERLSIVRYDAPCTQLRFPISLLQCRWPTRSRKQGH